MLTSLDQLIATITTDKSKLESDLPKAVEYLETYPTKGNERILFFSPGNFDVIIQDEGGAAPKWLTENILQVVEAFTQKSAYGSVIGLFNYLAQKCNRDEVVKIIIDAIKADRASSNPKLSIEAYNYMFLASVYADFVDVWKYLITDCKVDINYQTNANGYKMFAFMYAAKSASHVGLMQFLAFSRNVPGFNPNLQNKFGETALMIAANGMYFSKGIPRDKKIGEMSMMLMIGANVFLLSGSEKDDNRSALNEIWRVAPSSGAAELLIQYGAGLMKQKYRAIDSNSLREAKSIAGFDAEKYNNADAVLIAKNKTTNELVWLYGTAAIAAALKDPNLEIKTEAISKQLKTVDPTLLGSLRVLTLFTQEFTNKEVLTVGINTVRTFLPGFDRRKTAAALLFVGTVATAYTLRDQIFPPVTNTMS